MRKLSILAAVVGAALLSAAVVSADVKITSVSGIVRVVPAGGGAVIAAAIGQVVPTGSEINTGENGRVTIETSPGNTLRLRENGKLLVLEPKPKENRIQFLAGRIKGMFHHLVGGEKFSLEFADNAVASIKGTDVVAESTDTVRRISTIYGAIEFHRGGTVVLIPQGCSASIAGVRIKMETLTEEQIREGLADWEAEQAQHKATGSSDDMKMFMSQAGDVAGQAQELVTQIREDDFAAGRTMRDVHGNLTRIDQRILRPTAREVAFVNLCKRDTYQYKGKYKYTGGDGVRFDYLEAKVVFNADLPSSLLNWPSFFSSHDGVEPDLMQVTISNGKPIGDDGRDMFVSSSQKVILANGDKDWVDTVTLNGVKIESDDTVTTVDSGGGKDGSEELWGMSKAGFYFDRDGDKIYDAGTDTKFFMITEGYCINNDGKILKVSDFLNNPSMDPIGMLKTVAMEGIVAGEYTNGSAVFNRGNIDLVMTPDIVLAVVSKLASQIPSMAGDMKM